MVRVVRLGGILMTVARNRTFDRTFRLGCADKADGNRYSARSRCNDHVCQAG